MADHPCDPKEIALKSFFLGPQAENAQWIAPIIQRVFERWSSWRKSLFPKDGRAISDEDQLSESFMSRRHAVEEVTQELLSRFEGEVPKFSPRYAGHMFSEVSLPALIGHIVTLLHNPNNISGEASRVGTQIENEAVSFLLSMMGYPEVGTGHFTSGGTIANLEALVRAQQRMSLWLATQAAIHAAGLVPDFDPTRAAHIGWEAFDASRADVKRAAISDDELTNWRLGLGNPNELSSRLQALSRGRRFMGPVLLVPDHKHYSWQKGCRLLGLGAEALWSVQLDAHGRLSIPHLEELIDAAFARGRPILMIVSVLGTTELGGIDPVDQVQDVVDRWKKKGVHIWHHVDAAYGGFFRAIDPAASRALSQASKRALEAASRSDSLTLDPHKLGYVPYASGAYLNRDRRDYYFSTFEEAPYVDFDPLQDRGPYTLEGSRSAAGAVATWMTAKTMGLGPQGYGLLLERTARIAREFGARLEKEGLGLQLAPGCDTNILCFACARPGEPISKSNQRTLKVFEAFSPRRKSALIVSKTLLHWSTYGIYLDHWTNSWAAVRDSDDLLLIRMTLMNPFFSSVETDINYSDLFVAELKRVLTSSE